MIRARKARACAVLRRETYDSRTDRSASVSSILAAENWLPTSGVDHNPLTLITFFWSGTLVPEHQRQVVARHLHDLLEHQPAADGDRHDGLEVAHAPRRVLAAELAVERLERPGWTLFAEKRTVQDEHAPCREVARRAAEEAHARRPGRRVREVDRDDGRHRLRLPGLLCRA